ncbi:hypothetical protein VTN49DRAFT_5239 [Thermomyces lanuginosus]|uniref:uncharacterized protein n=1 Tax=Thermomyces lanuginosus TaxID=5541 RepID=UPI0037449D6B
MKFAGVMLALAVAATAAPSGKAYKRQDIPSMSQSTTMSQIYASCGMGNQALCCNDSAGILEYLRSGEIAGTLKNLLGSKNGAVGLSLFDQCSPLNLRVPAKHCLLQERHGRKRKSSGTVWYTSCMVLTFDGQSVSIASVEISCVSIGSVL